MRHKLKLSIKERINAWLELCDFSFRLMKGALTSKQLAKRLKKMRKEHIAKNRRLLEGLAELKGK